MARAGRYHAFGIGAWSLAVFAGYAAFVAHHLASVETPLPPAVYPANAPRPVAGRATLLMFIHAKCPCTPASLEQLALLARELGDTLSPHVLAVVPGEAGAEWLAEGNWELAAAIDGITLHRDTNGRLARQFQAVASGATVMYDRSGVLAFAGGLTSQRGHAGPSAGTDAVRRIARGEAHGAVLLPVFGCALFERAVAGEANS